MSNDRINVVSVKASFVGAALYKIDDNLISYSALLDGSHLFVRIVVNSAILPSGEDLLYDILGGIVGDFGEMFADFEMIKVESASAALAVELLPITLFHRAI